MCIEVQVVVVVSYGSPWRSLEMLLLVLLMLIRMLVWNRTGSRSSMTVGTIDPPKCGRCSIP